MPRYLSLRLVVAALGLSACLDSTGPDEPFAEMSQPEVMVRQPQLDVGAAAADAWGSRAPMLTARNRLTAGVVANTAGQPILYAIGGNDNSSVPLRKVEAYNPATNSWAGKAALPAARNLTNGTGAIGGKLYVSGGVLADNTVTRSLVLYSPATNTWTSRANLPVGSAQGVSGVISGRLYVLIGYCGGCSEGTRVRRLYRYDPATNSWARLANAPGAHLMGAGGVINGKFYVTGGYDASGHVTAALHVYDPVTNTWATKTSLPTARQEAAAGVIGGKLYVVGGSNSLGTLSTRVEAYDPVSNSWSSRAPLSAGRAGLAAGVAKNSSGQAILYALGGFRGGAGVLATNEAYGAATPQPDFSVGCDPSAAVIPQASAGTITCTVISVNGFAGSVALSAGTAPAGVALTPFATSVIVPANGSARVPVSVNVGSSVALASYSFSIVATSSALRHTYTATLTVSANTARVHVVYLIPSDKTYQPSYALSTERAIRHLQLWYRNALNTGETFTLTNPVVSVYHTGHSSEWYNTNNAATGGGTTFWSNATADGFALTGGGFYQPNDVWIFYIDADPAPGQAVGGAAGVALLPANDLRGLVGQSTQPVCRWVGGLGHELGHAFGLPHPAECDPVQTADCPTYALMWFGYTTYPSASLTSSDKQILGNSAFFGSLTVTAQLFNCSTLAPATLAAGLTSTTGDVATTSTRVSSVGGQSASPMAQACGHGQLRASLIQVLVPGP